MLEALKALREKYPPRKELAVVVHLDDCLSLFRSLRKMGYRLKRTKRSVWIIQDTHGFQIMEVWVDWTRSGERGKFPLIDIPTFSIYTRPSLTLDLTKWGIK